MVWYPNLDKPEIPNPKSQAPNKSQYQNLKIPNMVTNIGLKILVIGDLVFGIYLGIGYWDLEFFAK